MIVLDASVAVEAVLRDGPARWAIQHERLRAPHLIDTEVLSALRRLVLSGAVDEQQARSAVAAWTRLQVGRDPAAALTGRVWALRATVTAYDATYVALAESLGCALVTADARLARAPGVRCPVVLLPR